MGKYEKGNKIVLGKRRRREKGEDSVSLVIIIWVRGFISAYEGGIGKERYLSPPIVTKQWLRIS